MTRSDDVRRILLTVAIGLLGLGFTAADVEAKRLGGGISQGLKRPPPAASPRPQPDAAPKQPPSAQQPAAAPNAAAAAATPAKRSWLGPIAGLAAGLGIAALMSHLGLGDAFANILTLMLLALVAVVAVRWLMRRFGPAAQQPAGMRYAAAGADAKPATRPVFHGAAWASSPQAAGATSTAPVAASTATARPVLPAGFDHAAFERAAKTIFIRLQDANDRGDVEDLRRFSTPEMFAAFRVDLQDRGDRGQRTDVVKLDADVVDWAVEDGRQVVSVRYHGLVREDEGASPTPFDEVWHLVQPQDGSGSWAIAGIQQLDRV
jgi:predicted lipid-binding transport protein (Tim44 family)